MRPFPKGNASSQRSAGCLYQSSSSTFPGVDSRDSVLCGKAARSPPCRNLRLVVRNCYSFSLHNVYNFACILEMIDPDAINRYAREQPRNQNYDQLRKIFRN
jgi:hypothetical protein